MGSRQAAGCEEFEDVPSCLHAVSQTSTFCTVSFTFSGFFKIIFLFISLSLSLLCYVPCGMWDLSSRPRIEPVPPLWECRVLTTGPSGKSLPLVLDFDQMRCSLQASKFRSSPLPRFFLQKCFRTAVPGRAGICVSSARFDLSVIRLPCPVPVSATSHGALFS